jgi:hypothetical protein
MRWLSWRSPWLPVRLWHVLLDGTWCPCERSARYKAALALALEDPSELDWGVDP